MRVTYDVLYSIFIAQYQFYQNKMINDNKLKGVYLNRPPPLYSKFVIYHLIGQRGVYSNRPPLYSKFVIYHLIGQRGAI